MIFVTIGTQEPFDRLIEAIDSIIPSLISEPVIAQVSNSNLVVNNMEIVNFLSPNEFERLFSEARLIISHAGMGTIISAMTVGKPILVMPRIASLGEHRNEHQIATAKQMEALGYIYVAYNVHQLKNKIATLMASPLLEPLHKLEPVASGCLIDSLKNVINEI